MAEYKRIANGNLSTLAEWEEWNGASWVAASSLPSIGDIAYANGFNTIIDQNWTLSEIRNNTFNGTTASGRFEITSPNITLDAYKWAQSTYVLYISFGSGTSYVNGDMGGSTRIIELRGLPDGVLEIETVKGGNASARHGISTTADVTAAGKFRIIANDIIGGTGGWAYGIFIDHDGYELEIIGTAQTIDPAAQYTAHAINCNNGVKIISKGIIYGASVADSGGAAIAIQYSAVSEIYNEGIIQATSNSPAILIDSVSVGTTGSGFNGTKIYLGGTIIDEQNWPAIIGGQFKYNEGENLTWTTYNQSNQSVTIYDQLNGVLGQAAESDVRKDVVYGPSSELTGELEPVVVDTAQLASDLLDEIQTSSHVVAQRLRASATDDSVGNIVTSTLGAP